MPGNQTAYIPGKEYQSVCLEPWPNGAHLDVKLQYVASVVDCFGTRG